MAVRKRRKPRKENEVEIAPVTPQETAKNKQFLMTLVIISILFIIGFVLLQYMN